MEIDPALWKVKEELKKSLQCSKRYVLAVSGGADSLALAYSCAELFAEQKENLLVCHVEHGIRGAESLEDAKLVEAHCQRLKLKFSCCHVNASAYALQQGKSLEEAARELRYEALREQLESFAAHAVVTAHQADDQAETVLWKLLRGAGSEGLCGMQSESLHNGLRIIRPFLELTRRDIEKFCQVLKLAYCQDSTNEDLSYTRNRIRRELLPYLERHFNAGVKATLVREAKLLAEEQSCLASLTAQLEEDGSLVQAYNENGYQGYQVDAVKLLQQPIALRKRFLRSLYFKLGGKELSYERTEALDKLCSQGTGGKLVQLPKGVEACYRKKKLFIYLCNKEKSNERRY